MQTVIGALVLGMSLGACGGKKKEPRKDPDRGKEHGLLDDSARLYWEGVRWGDPEKSSAFIERADVRLVFKAWLEDEKESHRYVDVNVLMVVMSDELRGDEQGRLRTAKVHVRTEGYSYPDQILEKETVVQDWYRTMNGWWVDWDPPAEDDG